MFITYSLRPSNSSSVNTFFLSTLLYRFSAFSLSRSGRLVLSGLRTFGFYLRLTGNCLLPE